jgi:[acyl-carrier-protein] S-malonyltransferase
LAVLFAGQGAQKAGMGKSLYDRAPAAREIFRRAEAVRPGITRLCMEGGQEELDQTLNTQPCVFTVDMAAYAAFADAGHCADAGAGFSLGEYAALCAAGVLGFEDALRLVIARARWMQRAAEARRGGMAAVLGKTARQAEEIVGAARTDGLLVPVNYNCPGQVVVAGDEEQIANLLSYARENKIKCMRLPVNGAFHTERMQAAADKILEYISGLEFNRPAFPLYANKTARPYEMADMKRVLAEQTTSPVLFEQTIRALIGRGFDRFVEVGPGSTLTGFVKRIGEGVETFHADGFAPPGALE